MPTDCGALAIFGHQELLERSLLDAKQAADALQNRGELDG